jgi:hypothetical protein
MKAIIGMPRAGTTFLSRFFAKYGNVTNPPLFTDPIGYVPSWTTNECEAISFAFYCGAEGQHIVSLFNVLEKVLSFRSKHEAIYKQPQLVFLRNELLYFSEVIICVRPVESWVKSIINYEPAKVFFDEANRPVWLKSYNEAINNFEDKVFAIGKIWEERCYMTQHFLTFNGVRCHLCRFGEMDDYRKLFSHFGMKDNEIEAFLLNTWSGSKCDSNYRPYSEQTKPQGENNVPIMLCS